MREMLLLCGGGDRLIGILYNNRNFVEDLSKTIRLPTIARVVWPNIKGGAMLKPSQLWRGACLRADPPSTSKKSNLGLSLLFAAGTLCASMHGAAAAPTQCRDQRGSGPGLHQGRRRRVSRHSLRRTASRQFAMDAAREACALVQGAAGDGLWPAMRADRDAWRFRRAGEQQ